jgi:serine/threonine-protein kinase
MEKVTMNTEMNAVLRTSLRGYQLKSIGHGGVGKVYRSLGPEGRGLVYKIEKKGAEVGERIRGEARIGFEVAGSPGVVRIREIGQIGKLSYIGMEPVAGITLDQLLNEYKGKLPSAMAVDILRALCEILKNLHNQKICHGDLKPKNIMVNLTRSEKGVKVEVTLIDFGNAVKFSDPDYSYGITPAYCSPEQVRCEKIDQRSDIFALGIVLLEMLTGKNPFMAGNQKQVVSNILYKEVPSNLLRDKALSLDLCMILLKMLEKKTSERCQNCEEILSDLKAMRS